MDYEEQDEFDTGLPLDEDLVVEEPLGELPEEELEDPEDKFH